MTEPRADVPPTDVAGRRRVLILGAGVVALLSCALTLWATGAAGVVSLPGIPAPGAEVTWLVPALRLVADAAAVLTVGCLLGAVVLVPGDQLLSAAGYRWVRLAGWGATAWAAVSLISLPVLLADFLGTRLSAISLRGVGGFVVSVDQGRAQLLVAALAAMAAVAARTVLTPSGARVLLVVALAATIPPALTGHTADEAGHTLAVTGVVLHVVGVVLWAGGLLALVLAAKLTGAARTGAVERFSRLALPLALLVAGSGVITALTRLSAPGQLLETSYGAVLLAKTTALIGLVAIGSWHRRRTLPGLRAGRPRVFLRLASAEVLVFAATIGLAVGLARTPTPPVQGNDAGAAALQTAAGKAR